MILPQVMPVPHVIQHRTVADDLLGSTFVTMHQV